MRAKLLFTGLLLSFLLNGLYLAAQPLVMNLDSDAGFPGDTVHLPLWVENFTAISGYQGTFTWDTAQLELLQFTNGTPGINNITGTPGQGSIPPGSATFLWVDFSGGSKTILDSSVLLTISFKVKSNATFGVTTPVIIDGSITALGYSDGVTLFPPTVNQGSVTVLGCTSTADASFTLPASVCANAVAPLPVITGDPGGTFTVNQGASIDPTTGALDLSTTTPGVNYLVTYTVGSGCAAVESEFIQILSSDDASFLFPDTTCVNGSDPAATVTGLSGGTFGMDLGASIDPATGTLDLLSTTPGTTYLISYVTNGTCPDTGLQTIFVQAEDDAGFTFPDSVCIDGLNPTPTLTGQPGGTFSVDLGASIDPATGTLDLSSVSPNQSYQISYQTSGPCPSLSSRSVFVRDTGDATFAYPDTVCPNGPNPVATVTGTSGGIFSVSPAATIDPATGELDLSSVNQGISYLITYTVGSHCPVSSSQTVVAEDQEAPATISLPTVFAACDTMLSAPTTTDQCAGVIAGTTTDPVSYSGQGTFIVNWTFDDGNGNSISVPQTVIISDTIAPVVICQNITLQLSASGSATLDAAQVDGGTTDNCGLPSLSVSPSSFTAADLGPNLVTLVATDPSGNVDSCTAIVTVSDYSNPVAVCLPNVALALDSLGQAQLDPLDLDDGSTVFDNQPIFSLSQTDFDCSDLGNPSVTLYVADLNGAQDSCTSVVTVQDTLPPTVQTRDTTVDLGTLGLVLLTPEDLLATAFDGCGLANQQLDRSTFTCSDIGLHTVRLTLTDGAGNVTVDSALVTIVDATAPVVSAQSIILTLDATGQADLNPSDVNLIARDPCGIQSPTLSQTSFDCSHLGPNQVIALATDIYGNVGTDTIEVLVQDVTPPTAVCQDLVVRLDSNGWAVIEGAMLDDGSSDACGIASLTVNQDSFSAADLGPNAVILEVRDSSGNVAMCPAIVTVEEATSIAGLAGADRALQVFPNPTEGRFTLRWRSETPGPLAASVIDELGRTVWQADGQQVDSTFERSLNLSELPAGVYLIRVRQGEVIRTQRLVKR